MAEPDDYSYARRLSKQTIQDDLYIVGLAYRFAPERMNNFAVLQYNLGNRFRLDYLKYDWYEDEFSATGLMPIMNMNYVAPMIFIAEHFKDAGRLTEAGKWISAAQKIAVKAGRGELVDKYLEKKGLKSLEE